MTTFFEFTGRFGGFVFTDAGKRRMLLRQNEQNRLLKVPRMLRRRIIGKFRAGELIRVTGTEEKDFETGAVRLVVAQVLPTVGEVPAASVPSRNGSESHSSPGGVVRVCSKKNCWRNGGHELFDALGRELAASGLAGQVERRQVGCLDRCKQAPNADVGGCEFSRCTPAMASEIIAQVVQRSLPCETRK